MTERDFTAPSIMLMDVETSGFLRKDLTLDDPAQPWALQIAACLCNRSGVITNMFSHIIKAENRRTTSGAFKTHGISHAVTARIGVPEPRVLGTLLDMLKTAPLDEPLKLVTYGDFDIPVISSLLARFAVSQGKPSTSYDRVWHSRPMVEHVNLMVPFCQDVCQIPNTSDFGQDFKWPSLDEAAEMILGRPPREGHHDAWTDMLLLKDLYFHFQNLGVFDREPAVA